jgi:hypothetical protein
MEKCPSWEANRFSASQEIPYVLWSQKVHYRIRNSPSLRRMWTFRNMQYFTMSSC